MTSILDPLAYFYVHTVSVERFAGDSAYGDEFAAATDVTGFYSDRTLYSGGDIIAQGRFAFPLTVAPIPVQSRITLPDEFGGRQVRVVSVEIGDSGGLPLPDHQTIGVL